jgi:hypothetical protein
MSEQINAHALARFAESASWIYQTGVFRASRRELRLCFTGEYKVQVIGRGAAKVLYRGKDLERAAQIYNDAFKVEN